MRPLGHLRERMEAIAFPKHSEGILALVHAEGLFQLFQFQKMIRDLLNNGTVEKTFFKAQVYHLIK